MKRLSDLAKTASERDCEQMLDELESFRDSAAITDEAQQRILSSVMKKAGFEMNDAIRMTDRRRNRAHTEKPEPVSVVRRGHHVLAACIALAVIAAAAGAVIFGGRLNTEPEKQPPQSSLALSSASEQEQTTSEAPVAEDTAAVPEVAGLQEEEAKQALEDAGFVPVKRVTFQYMDEGIAVYTDPEKGTALAKGSEVRYYVSRRPFDLESLEKDELIKAVNELADLVTEYYSETIDGYNAVHETKFSLERAGEDAAAEHLRELGQKYETMLNLSQEQMADYIVKSFLTGTAKVPDVCGLSEEEAAAKLSEAGFVPYFESYEVTSFSEGIVTRQTEWEELDIGSLVGYTVSKVGETVKAVPEFDGAVYEDDELSIKVNRLLCDGNYVIVGYEMESKTENWETLMNGYVTRVLFADTGEEYEEYRLFVADREMLGKNKLEKIEGYMLNPEMRRRGIMLDVFKADWMDDNGDLHSDKKDRLLTIPLECNVPTRTLTSEDGLTLALSPMGVMVSGKAPTELEKALGGYAEVVYVTKDGRRVSSYDDDSSEGRNMHSRTVMEMYTDDGYVWCCYGWTDIENIDHVEINGVVFS